MLTSRGVCIFWSYKGDVNAYTVICNLDTNGILFLALKLIVLNAFQHVGKGKVSSIGLTFFHLIAYER